MTTLLESLLPEATTRLRALSAAAENVDWPTHVAQTRGWRKANEAYHAQQEAQGYVEMQHLLVALGLRPPLTPEVVRDVLQTAVELYLQTEATTAVVQAAQDGVQIKVSRCPLFDRFADPSWQGVTACGCFSRIDGWHDALGVPADVELVTNRKWDDPVCHIIFHLPDKRRIGSTPAPAAGAVR
jgi:hypothetical protein